MEWWVSDGSAERMSLVRDLWPGIDGSTGSRGHLVHSPVGGVMVFIAKTSATTEGIWRTDGTPEGTYLLRDLSPGTPLALQDYDSEVLGHASGVLYLKIITAAHGREVWRTDGTVAGTRLLADLAPGAAHAWPSSFVNVGDVALFAAESPEVGEEIWRIADDEPPVLTSVRYDYNAASPTLILSFNEPIGDTFSLQDLLIVNLSTGTPVQLSAANAWHHQATGRIVIDARDPAGNGWVDGTYRVTIPEGSVGDGSGNVLASAAHGEFFILAGDANRDRRVDFSDLLLLSQHYGRSGMTFAQGNLD
jgi:ELWxxDGT repeat protein